MGASAAFPPPDPGGPASTVAPFVAQAGLTSEVAPVAFALLGLAAVSLVAFALGYMHGRIGSFDAAVVDAERVLTA